MAETCVIRTAAPIALSSFNLGLLSLFGADHYGDRVILREPGRLKNLLYFVAKTDPSSSLYSRQVDRTPPKIKVGEALVGSCCSAKDVGWRMNWNFRGELGSLAVARFPGGAARVQSMGLLVRLPSGCGRTT
jgi:hypothetical protein